MSIRLENSFSRFFVEPFKFGTIKDKIVKFAVPAICMIFALGTVYVIQSLQNRLKLIPVDKQTLAISLKLEYSRKSEKLMQVTKKTLDSFSTEEAKHFVDSFLKKTSFGININDLPIYPDILSLKNPSVKIKKMEGSFVKGTIIDGRPFIAGKLHLESSPEKVSLFISYPSSDKALFNPWTGGTTSLASKVEQIRCVLETGKIKDFKGETWCSS